MKNDVDVIIFRLINR